MTSWIVGVVPSPAGSPAAESKTAGVASLSPPLSDLTAAGCFLDFFVGSFLPARGFLTALLPFAVVC